MREHGLAGVPRPATSRRRESAFSMVELLVVLVIVGILMAVALPSIRSASRGPEAPSVAIAGGKIWRAVQLARLDNGGVFPTTSDMQGRATGLVDAANRPRVLPWPETGRGVPIDIKVGTSAAIPTTGPDGTLQYWSSGSRAWLVGFGTTGKVVFRRAVTDTATPAAPAG